jgi:hypothetical protein
MDAGSAERVLKILDERNITCVTVGHEGHRAEDDRADRYDATLELKSDGEWAWKPKRKPRRTRERA